ncbi:hypothetical protein VTI28DRAFT_1716 [Corynascus sepedonium]
MQGSASGFPSPACGRNAFRSRFIRRLCSGPRLTSLTSSMFFILRRAQLPAASHRPPEDTAFVWGCRGPKFHWPSTMKGLKLLSFPSRTPSVLLLGPALQHHARERRRNRGTSACLRVRSAPRSAWPALAGHTHKDSRRVEVSRNTKRSKNSGEMLRLTLRDALRFYPG